MNCKHIPQVCVNHTVCMFVKAKTCMAPTYVAETKSHETLKNDRRSNKSTCNSRHFLYDMLHGMT